MNAVDVFKIFEAGLSIVGFFALSYWMLNWAKGLSERTVELSELDKEIRATLRDSFEAHKELHDMERKRLAYEMDGISKELENKSSALHQKEELLQTIVHAIQIGGEVVVVQQKNTIEKYNNLSREKYEEIIAMLIERQMLTKEEYLKIIKTQPKVSIAETESTQVGVFIAIRLTEILVNQSKAAGATEMIALTLPKVLNYVFENPEEARMDIRKAVKEVLIS